MMKWITIIFLLVNVAYFGWHLNQQINQAIPATANETDTSLSSSVPLVLLSELNELPPLREESTIPQHEQGQNSTIAITEDLLDEMPAFTKEGACITIGPFQAGIADAERISIKNWLTVRSIPVREHIEEQRTRERYWVYLEPKATEEEAKAQVEALKQKGVSDYYMITRGDMKNAISLGLFSSQDKVNNRLEELAKEGYQPVVIPQHKVEQHIWIDAQLLSASDNLQLPELPEGVKVNNKDCSMIALTAPDQ